MRFRMMTHSAMTDRIRDNWAQGKWLCDQQYAFEKLSE